MTQYADSVGARIAYDSQGEGPDLVFLHAGIADRTMWQPQIDLLSDRFRCTTFDMRGVGGTEIGEEPFSRRDDLASVMDAVGASAATVIGCSLGAGFSLDFAIERPERVSKLVLVGVVPAGFDYEDPVDMSFSQEVDEAIEAGDFAKAASLETRFWVDGPRRPPGSAPEWLRDKVQAWCEKNNQVTDWGDSIQLDPPAMGRLGEVIAPTLVMVGTEDADVVLAGCRATAAGIAGARLVELSDTAHLPSLEVADEFNAALLEFLADVPQKD